MAAAPAYVAFAHCKHSSEPVPVLYVPATHCEHNPPSGPDEPEYRTKTVL